MTATGRRKWKAWHVSTCGSCPFLTSGLSGLNRCGRMPNDRARDGLSKYGVNDDHRAPTPSWCPLRSTDVVIKLALKNMEEDTHDPH